ncbi:MAG: hypothetical protein DRN53_07770, partial [Thermoprotei archaeon]
MYESFIRDIRKVAERFKVEIEGGSVLLVTHYDADGLTSAAIVARMLELMEAPYHIRVVEQLDKSTLEEILTMSYDSVFITDLSLHEPKVLTERAAKTQLIIVLDHHETTRLVKENRVIVISPYSYNIDGSSLASSSTMAYMFVKEVSNLNEKLSYLAVIGALGDRQDVGKLYTLEGLNKIAVEDATRLLLLRTEIDLRLFGLRTKPLIKCLEHCIDPYIPGLTGNENACLSFLKSIGIPPTKGVELRMYSDLSLEERKRLATELVKYLLARGYSVKQAESIFGTVYYLLREKENSYLYDAREFSALLNACGRMERESTGIALAMGFRGSVLKEALSTLQEYRKLLARALDLIREPDGHVSTIGKLVVIDLRKIVPPRVVGTIASLATPLYPRAKVVMVYSGEHNLKVSVRRTTTSIREDIHLGEIMKQASSKVGGIGGGHPNAAGAQIPEDSIERFIRIIHNI